jgi:hypothetical protein
LPYALNVREFWADRFIKSDLDFSEKKEILKSIAFLFKEFEKFDIEPYKYYLLPLFDHIVNERFDEAVLLSDVLKGFINKQEQLEHGNGLNYKFKMNSDELNKLELDILRLKDQNINLENLVKAYRSRKVVKTADTISKIYNVPKLYLKKFFNSKSTNVPNENKINVTQSVISCVDFETATKKSTNINKINAADSNECLKNR